MILALILICAALAFLATWAVEELITEPECTCGLPGRPPAPAVLYDQDDDAS